jgi:hypothetical protein
MHGMSKRVIAAFLWFGAAWLGYEIVWSLTGVPRVLGPVVATAIAAFVALDPVTLFWSRISTTAKTGPAVERSRVGV